MKKVFPFEAAIFDLDGTLLDSMYVWHHIDDVYFQRRGMTTPPDYGRALAGLSYRESAEYTKARFGFPEPWEEIVKEWTDLAHEEYACHVPLKPGALEYITALRRAGVKLAVATALPEYLYRPCLEHLGILNHFCALCSTDETGGRGKKNGEVFLLAAERMGVAPERCAVFEDTLEGLRGAQRAGMLAYCAKDPSNSHAYPEIETFADGMFDTFFDILPERRCVIFTARCKGDAQAAYADRRADDLILCADAGYELAQRAGAEPDWIIGDFDSAERPDAANVLIHPVIKDDTDTMLCVKYALEMGVRDFCIIGGLGGRLDHTLANLQTLIYLAERGASARLCDGNTCVRAVKDGGVRIARTGGKLSVFALGGKCEGVYIRGAKYNLEDGVLTPDFPLGMGNDFAEDLAEIGVKKGTLLVLWEMKQERL